jgi:Flp pilus assembly protein TadD
VDAQFFVGMIFYRKGLYAKAVKMLQVALKYNPDHPAILYHIGLCYNHLNQPTRAIPPLKRVTELTPDDHRAFYALGMVYDRADMREEARASYRAADARLHGSRTRVA